MPASHEVIVRLTKDEMEAIDEVRGEITRQEWVRREVANLIGARKRRTFELTEQPWPMLPEPRLPEEGKDLRSVRSGNRDHRKGTPMRFDLDSALRAVSVIRLRSEGVSFEDIATRLGYSSAHAAQASYKLACERYISHAAVEYGKVIIAEHVADVERAQAIFDNPGYKTDVKGALVAGPGGEWLLDVNAQLAALTEKRKTLESIRRMTGVDAPKRTEVEVRAGEELNEKIKVALERVQELTAGRKAAPEDLPDDIVEAEITETPEEEDTDVD